jgi:alkaline phosphatase D
MIIFDQDQRTITMESWRFLANVADPGPDDQFPGWPLTISQFDNYGREAFAWLPKLNFNGEPDPVVEVINQETGEYEYMVRIKGNEFSPKVFSGGLYTLRVGYPEQDNWQTIENLEGLSSKDEEVLQIDF